MGGGSSTTQTSQAQQQVQTPQTPEYVTDPTKNYYSGIDAYQHSDPYALVTPANALQTGAFQNAGGLFQSGSLYGQAAQGAQNAMNATPTTYTAGFNGVATGNLGQASQANATGYQAPSLGSAAQVQGPNLGQASTYDPYMTGQAAQATATGYQAPTLSPAAQSAAGNLNGTATTATAASLLDNLSAYQNPAQAQLVNSTLASMDDNAARVRAAQQAQFARSGAFGGSRAGITQAQTEADLARERGLAEANLNTQAWNAATQLSAQDAANRQQTSLFNAGAQNQRDETGAALTTQNNQFNAGQQNQFGLAQGQLAADAAQFGANAQNQASLFNAGAANDLSLANQNAANQAGQFNAGQANDFALRGADLQQQANLANQAATNSFAQQQAGLLADAGQFNAGAQNQASLFNAGANNQYSLAQFEAQNAANQFNAGQANQLGQFNASALNEAQQQQLARQMQGSALLGDIAGQYAGDYRADLAMQSDLGNQLYQLQDRYTQAPLTQLQNTGNLLNPGLIQSLSGQTITSQSNGVDQTKKSGGLLNGLLGVASLGAKFIPSDRRLKRNIEKIGEEADGLGRYRWNYAWGDMVWPEASEGVMADEVARLRPWALGPDKAGYATVNYGAL